MRTASTEGLILHINGKHNKAQLALYMTNGKIKLAVGKGLIHHNKRINDNEWHKVLYLVSSLDTNCKLGIKE